MDELTNLMHLEFFDGEERTSLAVHCWFAEISKDGDPTYWLNRLEITKENIVKHRGEWGNKWNEVDLSKIKFAENN